MILTKAELIASLHGEVRILLHLISKVEPPMLDYRPTPKQRSMLELLQYLTLVGPIHMRGALAPAFDIDAWRAEWTAGEATAKMLNLDAIRDSIASQPALYETMLGGCTNERLRGEIAMFGHTASRGS